MNRFKALNYFLEISARNFSSQLNKCNFLSSDTVAKITTVRFCSNEAVSPANSEEPSILQPVEKIDLSDYGSEMEGKFNFAMYADKSPILQKYIDLGVNLYEVEKRPDQAQYLVTLSLNRIQPYLLFLKDIGVPEDDFGKIITKNPFLFKEDLDDLQVRINYLQSKKFNTEMITTIIKKCPRWLSFPVKSIDERLGYLQQTFRLTGDEVRSIIVRVPKLAIIKKKFIIVNTFTLKEEMGLDIYSLKKAVVAEPSLLRINPYDLVATYEYLIKVMKVQIDLVLKQPEVLTSRCFVLKERHKFLESLGRAQYCHLLPGYVNLGDLVRTSDAEFCEKIAKTSTDMFYNFIKTF